MSTFDETMVRASALTAGYRAKLSPMTIAIALMAVENVSHEYNWHNVLDWDVLESDIDTAIYELMTQDDISMLGAIIPFALGFPGEGWLLCDGSTYDPDEYPDLYEYLASTTLPDLTGRVLRGEDAAIPMNTAGGSDETTLTENQIPSHYHTANVHTHTGGVVSVGYSVAAPGAVPVVSGIVLGATGLKQRDTNYTGGGAAHSNIQASFGVQYHIRAVK